MIEPALTPKEWERWEKVGSVAWWHVIGPNGPSREPDIGPRALAAWLLHARGDQPFFTWEMVDAIRDLVTEHLPIYPDRSEEADRLASLACETADRIAALLPPRKP